MAELGAEAPLKASNTSWVTSAPTPTSAEADRGSAWADGVALSAVRLARPAVPEATAKAATIRMLLVRRKDFNGCSLFGARTVDLKEAEAPTKPDKT